MIHLIPKDLEQLGKKGISKEKVGDQIQTFKTGILPITLAKAAVISDGILRLSAQEQEQLIHYFETERNHLELLKFVPASGAASRMFTALFNFLETYNPAQETLSAYVERTGDIVLQKFSDYREHFPFYDRVMNRISGRAANEDEEVYYFIHEMLSEDRLNYGDYPKALLPFHQYSSETATPFEEQVKEAARYAKTRGKVHLHFTISKQHETLFKAEESKVVPKIAQATDTGFTITYSYQKPYTDTIAVTIENQPFRDSQGAIVFRPGGHGALLENLNEQDADIIFIKNIDNVMVDRNLEEMAKHKKMLAGLLLKIQTQAFNYAEELESGSLSSLKTAAIKTFLEKEVNVRFPENYADMSAEAQHTLLKDKINRPLRVCGMIQTGEDSGGGPFWVKNTTGYTSLQIVESVQIDRTNKTQAAIVKNATHFNPVDLVCGIRNHKGEKYNLLQFADAKQGFITMRTKEGKTVKALELPGLWNGGMAFWNTVFVEVPRATFNPVKTVTDLLKPTHQTLKFAPKALIKD